LFSRAVLQAVWPTGESRFVSDRIGQIGTVGVKTKWLVESLERRREDDGEQQKG
jgi:hypothetical protein